MGIDPDTASLDKLRENGIAALQNVSERYEKILRDRGEDPYSPLNTP